MIVSDHNLNSLYKHQNLKTNPNFIFLNKTNEPTSSLKNSLSFYKSSPSLVKTIDLKLLNFFSSIASWNQSLENNASSTFLNYNIGRTLEENFLPEIGAVNGIVGGVKQSIDVFENIDDLRKSDAKKFGAMGLGSAGASIGGGIGVASAIATGASIGSTFPVVGTLIGAGVGAVIGFASGFLGSSKSKERMARDAFRDGFEKVGLSNLNERKMDMLKLADGSEYNIGEEGFIEKTIYDPSLADPKLLSDRKSVGNKLIAYEVDYTNDLDYMSSLASNGLANFILQTKHDQVKHMGAHITNAVTSNASSREFNQDTWTNSMTNLQSMYQRVGITDINQGIHLTTNLLSEDVIGIHQANQFMQGLEMVFSDNETSFKLASTLNKTR